MLVDLLFRFKLTEVFTILTLVMPITSLGSTPKGCGLVVALNPAKVDNLPPIPWPDWRLPDNPEIMRVMPDRMDKIEFRAPVKGSTALSKLAPEEIFRIASSDSESLAFVMQNKNELEVNLSSPKSIEMFRIQVQRMARILHTRLNVDLKPTGTAFTMENFKQQVKLSGEQLEMVHEAYRFDQRTPQEIVAAGGFFPNPLRKDSGISLLEHSLKTSFGGFFVSTTRKENNAKNIIPSGMFSSVSISDQNAQHLLIQNGVKSDEIGMIVSVRKAYEYKLKNITGVIVKDYGIDTEQELVTNKIGLNQITAVREVTLIEYLAPDLVQGYNSLDRAKIQTLRKQFLAFLSRESIPGPWQKLQ